jgi:hypothetical protein
MVGLEPIREGGPSQMMEEKQNPAYEPLKNMRAVNSAVECPPYKWEATGSIPVLRTNASVKGTSIPRYLKNSGLLVQIQSGAPMPAWRNADALRSGRSDRMVVEVQVLSPAPDFGSAPMHAKAPVADPLGLVV